MNLLKRSIQAIICLVIILWTHTAYAYSILAHEALVDSCWATSIQPLLLWKYPGATKAQLKKAHAYAYGGAIAPDIGYFPLGNPFFTNLVHYVRSGDFVNALLDDARNIDEYAFALGFLSHYMADKYGHSLATNRSVPVLYPKERQRFGDYVTYDEDHLSHKRVEFGFDALQTEEGDYRAIAYHDFIGFRISGPLLARAFSEIYGLDIHKVFVNFDLSIEMVRLSFQRLFPALTGAAWILKRNQLKKANHGSHEKTNPGSSENTNSGSSAKSNHSPSEKTNAASPSKSSGSLPGEPNSGSSANTNPGSSAKNNRSSSEKTNAASPGKSSGSLPGEPNSGSPASPQSPPSGIFYGFFGRTFSSVFALVIEIVPKVGPLKPMKFKAPGPDVAKLYYSSFDTTRNNFAAAMQDCRAGNSRLPNIDFDTGNFTTPGEYGLADENYDRLVVHLEKNKFKLMSRELKKNIVDYYSQRVAPTGQKSDHAWTKTQTALHQLRAAQASQTE